jgi:hypothetical protein
VVEDEKTVEKVLPAYVEKYGNGKDFYELFKAGKNQHQLYKFTPKKYFLFDEVNFSDGQKHEWITSIMKNAVLIHGMPSKDEYFDPSAPSLSNAHWFPWLQKQLIINGSKHPNTGYA